MAASKITNLLSALALAALVLPVGAYAAQLDTDAHAISVSTAGLDAARPSDQAVLRHRITVAAHNVCDAVMPGETLTAPGYAVCVSKANADARSQLEDRIATASSTTIASIALK